MKGNISQKENVCGFSVPAHPFPFEEERFGRSAPGGGRCDTYLAKSVSALSDVSDALYMAVQLCWASLIRQLVKQNSR